jgi:hypothetical protein
MFSTILISAISFSGQASDARQMVWLLVVVGVRTPHGEAAYKLEQAVTRLARAHVMMDNLKQERAATKGAAAAGLDARIDDLETFCRKLEMIAAVRARALMEIQDKYTGQK